MSCCVVMLCLAMLLIMSNTRLMFDVWNSSRCYELHRNHQQYVEQQINETLALRSDRNQVQLLVL